MWSSTTVNKPHGLQTKASAATIPGRLRGESPLLRWSTEHDVHKPPPQLSAALAGDDRMEVDANRSDRQPDCDKGQRFTADDGVSSAVLGSNTCEPAIPIYDHVMPRRKIQRSSKSLMPRRNLGTFSKKVVRSSDVKGSQAYGRNLVKEALRNLEFPSRRTKKFTVADELPESLQSSDDGAYFQKGLPPINVNNKTPNVATKAWSCMQLPSRELLAITDNRNDSFKAEGGTRDEATTPMPIASSPDAEDSELTMGQFKFDETEIDCRETHKETFTRLQKTLQETAINVIDIPHAQTRSQSVRRVEVFESLMDRLHLANEDRCGGNLPHRKDEILGDCGSGQPARRQIREIDALTCNDQLEDLTKSNAFSSSDRADELLEIDALSCHDSEPDAGLRRVQTEVSILHNPLEFFSPKMEILAPVAFESSDEVLSPELEAGYRDHMFFELPQSQTLTHDDRLESILDSSPRFTSFQTKSSEANFTDLYAEELMGMEVPSASYDNEKDVLGKWDGHFDDDSWERDMTVLSPAGTKYLNNLWSSPGSSNSALLNNSRLSEFDLVDSGTVLDSIEHSIVGCGWEADLNHISRSPESRICPFQKNPPLFSMFDSLGSDHALGFEGEQAGIDGNTWNMGYSVQKYEGVGTYIE